MEASSLVHETNVSILNFLIILGEEKNCRAFLVNKGILSYIQDLFLDAGESSEGLKTKEKIDRLICMVGSHVSPQSLSYSLSHFVVDMLCHGIEYSKQEIVIFEGLLG